MAADLRKELNAFVASIKATPTILSKIIVSESVNGSFNASYSKSHFCIGMCFVQGCITLVGFFLFLCFTNCVWCSPFMHFYSFALGIALPYITVLPCARTHGVSAASDIAPFLQGGVPFTDSETRPVQIKGFKASSNKGFQCSRWSSHPVRHQFDLTWYGSCPASWRYSCACTHCRLFLELGFVFGRFVLNKQNNWRKLF